jgi:hypothetical protein
VVFRLSAGRSAFELGDDLESGLAAETLRRPEGDADDVPRLEAESAFRFIAPAKEQLALVTDDRFHDFAFRFDGLTIV